MPATPHTMVVVEDEPDTAEMFAEMLRLCGFIVIKSYEGATAVNLIARVRPAAVVMDLMMPGVSGFDMLRAMHSDHTLAAIPVIIVSAKSMPADIARGLAAGAAFYLTKPVAFEELKAAINVTLDASDQKANIS